LFIEHPVDPGRFVRKDGRPLTGIAVNKTRGDGWFTFQIVLIAQHVTAIDIDPAL